MQEDTELEKTGPDATQGNLEIKHILLATNYTVIPDLIMADKKLDPLTKLLLGVIIKFIREKGQGRCFPKNPWLLGECPVCRAQRKKEELLKEKKAEQERLDFLTGYSRLEKKYLNKTFGNSNLRERKDYSTRAAYEECLAYAKDFPWPLERGSGLPILGSTGCGKSNMAAAICLTSDRKYPHPNDINTDGRNRSYMRLHPNQECSHRIAIIPGNHPPLDSTLSAYG